MIDFLKKYWASILAVISNVLSYYRGRTAGIHKMKETILRTKIAQQRTVIERKKKHADKDSKIDALIDALPDEYDKLPETD